MNVHKIACFGGIYNNYLALEAACLDAGLRGADDLYCLGDMGAFGPNPDRVFPLLEKFDVKCIRGNYDDSVARGLDNCQCGYTDPADNYFAKLSYDYTLKNTSKKNREFLGSLPDSIRLDEGGCQILLCHGSPRGINEFLWESTTPTHLLEAFCDQFDADLILVTHTGCHWKRELSNNRHFVNVGVLGRPANDGACNVWYTIITITVIAVSDTKSQPAGARRQYSLDLEFVPLEYDYRRLAGEMKAENLPDEFVQTILTGWWTTCLEILPFKERVRGKF